MISLRECPSTRHDDDHGLASVTTLEPGGIGFRSRIPGGGIHIHELTVNRGNIYVDAKAADGGPIVAEIIPPRAKLNRVYGRGNVPFDPPTTHMGAPLADESPLAVARLALVYMTALIEEAERLA